MGERVLEVLGALVHGRPILVTAPIKELEALRAAGVNAIETTREPPPSRDAAADDAVAVAAGRLTVDYIETYPDGVPLFAAPAWREDVEMLEATLGRPLPAHLYAWLTRHDGSSEETDETCLGGWWLHRAAAIESAWSFLCASDPSWFSRTWTPFATDGSGNHLCIDETGRVIEFVHDNGRRQRVADSFVSWLDAQEIAS